jgi:ABC-type Mn2+/Zn2+ transport system ATPase subunit
VGTLSGGQQQKVALARAVARRADALFLDEPFASLDAASRSRCAEVIAALHAAGAAVVMVSHDIRGLPVDGARRIRMREGRLVTDGAD